MGIKQDERMKYKGFNTKQVKGTDYIFDDFFIQEKFDTIIEIGTGNGGFSLYMAEKCNVMNTNFYTFDIKKKRADTIKMIRQAEGKFFHEDANKTNTIKNFIMGGGRTLILNDGDKFASFSLFAPMLKPNDYMFIHDYNVKKKRIFDGLATWADFQNGMKKFNLRISSYTKMFENYLWMCIKSKRNV